MSRVPALIVHRSDDQEIGRQNAPGACSLSVDTGRIGCLGNTTTAAAATACGYHVEGRREWIWLGTLSGPQHLSEKGDQDNSRIYYSI